MLLVVFRADESKSLTGFAARFSRTSTALLRPFVEATITFYNHTIADMENKTRAVLSAVAAAAQVPERDVLITHVIAHLDTQYPRDRESRDASVPLDAFVAGSPAAADTRSADTRSGGRRPVDSGGNQAHQHVTVTVKILVHKTDAAEPTAWALYHRLAYHVRPQRLNSSSASSNTNTNTSTNSSGHAGGGTRRLLTGGMRELASSGDDRHERGGKRKHLVLGGHRRSFDDTLWGWSTDEEGAHVMWHLSDGEGCALIEALKSSVQGETALRLLRVSVTGDELPLYYEFDNRSTSERLVEIIRHARGRDAAFYFAGFFTLALLLAFLYLGQSLTKASNTTLKHLTPLLLAFLYLGQYLTKASNTTLTHLTPLLLAFLYLGQYLLRRWILRQKYTRHMQHELDELELDVQGGEGRGRAFSTSTRGVPNTFSMSQFRRERDKPAADQAAEDDPS